MRVVETEEYGQRALCAAHRADVRLAGKDSRCPGEMDQPAREGRTRRWSARNDGRGEGVPDHRAAGAMTASDPSTPKGESANGDDAVNGQSYSLRCHCGKEWVYVGGLEADTCCPSCGSTWQVHAARFLYLKKDGSLSETVEVEVPAHVERVLQLQNAERGIDVEDALDAILDLKIEYDRPGGGEV